MALLRNRLIVCVGLAAALSAGLPTRARAENAASREYALKAAFLYNFLRFVEWPPDPRTPPLVCVVGAGEASAAVQRALAGKQVEGQAVGVQVLTSSASTESCTLVFVPDASQDAWPPLRTSLACRPVLTVGESAAFLAAGGSVSVFAETNRLRFDVNRAGTSCTGLRFSSKLLSLARTVDGRTADR